MEISFIPNVFDKNELTIISNIINENDWHSAETSNLKYSDHRSTKIKWTSNNILKEKILKIFNIANNLHYNFDIEIIKDISILRYDLNDFYEKHIDIGKINEHRKLSLIVPLSNNYDGGDTIFYTGKNPVYMLKDINAATVFPSFVLHEVTKVTKGTRYSLVAWAEGKRFK